MILFYACFYLSMEEHKCLAESNYKQLQNHLSSLESGKVSEKALAKFIEEKVLLKEYNRVFSAATLSQTTLLIQKQDLENQHKDLMIRSADKVKSMLFMNAHQKAKIVLKDKQELEANSHDR